MNPQETKELKQQLAQAIRDLNLCSQAYNSKNLKVTIFISGQESGGKSFAGMINANGNNQYLIAFFNQYGAACAAARITAEHLLNQAEIGE